MHVETGPGIVIEYETFGDPADPAILLVMGYGAQLLSWDEKFCGQLAARGRFVIRYDPTLVIHGLDDTLIQASGGRRTASLIPGARLLLVDDMGHDRPPALWPQLLTAIAEHTGGH